MIPNPFAGGALLNVWQYAMDDVVAYMVAAPEWRFATDPNNAIAYATTAAWIAAEGAWPVFRPDPDTGTYWTYVALKLVQAAHNPAITAGVMLQGLALRFNIAFS